MNGKFVPQTRLDPDAAFRQAVALQSQGDLAGAERIYRAILKLLPTNYDVLFNLGGVLWRREALEDAVRIIRKALNQKPNAAEAHTLLAGVLRSQGRYDEARQRLERAIALKPGFVESHSQLGQVLTDLGQGDEAARVLGQGIELAPGQPRLYFHLGNLRKWKAEDPRVAALQAMAQKPQSLTPDDKIFLHYALAKVYDDTGDIAESFRRQIEGAALKRRMLGYNEAATLQEMDEIGRACDARWISQRQRAGDPSALPIFIVGMPRSGTTLLEQLLVSLPGVQTLGETSAFTAALLEMCGPADGQSSLPQKIIARTDADFRRLGTRYLEAARRHVPADALRIVDKTPANFRLLGPLCVSLPGAKIIHAVRDPVDTCLSIFSTLFWSGSQPYSYDLGELGRCYRAYEKLMERWHEALPPGTILDVRYEDVIDDFEGQARRIIAHCGLEWDDACLTFYKSRGPVRTASNAQVRQPIYRSSVGRARPPQELLQPLLDGLGISA